MQKGPKTEPTDGIICIWFCHKNIQYDRFECEWVQFVAVREWWCFCCFNRKMLFRLIIIIIRTKAALIERKLVLFHRNYLHLPMCRYCHRWNASAESTFEKEEEKNICKNECWNPWNWKHWINDFTSALENSMTYKNFVCKYMQRDERTNRNKTYFKSVFGME